MAHWFRLCIDVDEVLQPVGVSYEVREDEGPVVIHVGDLRQLSPFDGVGAAVAYLVNMIRRTHGEVLSFPFAPTAGVTPRS